MDRRLLPFALIGAVAFAIDAGLYLFLGLWLSLPWLQKALSLLAGVSTTYLLNSLFTFRAPLALRRFLLYGLSQAAGMAVNFVVFLAALRLVPALLALPLATVAALAVNFLAARWVLSRAPRRAVAASVGPCPKAANPLRRLWSGAAPPHCRW